MYNKSTVEKKIVGVITLKISKVGANLSLKIIFLTI